MPPRKFVILLNKYVLACVLFVATFLPLGEGFAALFSRSTKPVNLTLGALPLRIPDNVFDFPQSEGDVTPALALVVLWPSLEGRTNANIKELTEVRGHGQRIRITINDISNQQNNFLDRYSLWRSEHGEMKWTKADMGLHFGTQALPDQVLEFRRRDLYVEGDIDAPTSFIECSIAGVVKSPGCDHHFMYRNFLFELSYGRTFLNQWKDIEVKVQQLFDSFVRP